jgi:hypothetical protein
MTIEQEITVGDGCVFKVRESKSWRMEYICGDGKRRWSSAHTQDLREAILKLREIQAIYAQKRS